MRAVGIMVLAAVIPFVGSVVVHAEADHAWIAQDSLTKVIRPGYNAFAASTAVLKEKTDAL